MGYKHEKSGALVLLTPTLPDQVLDPRDLLQCEHSVEWWGITDREKFYDLLKQATIQKAKVA